jgi:hypothetical protein
VSKDRIRVEYALSRAEVMGWYLKTWVRPSRLMVYRVVTVAALTGIAWLLAPPEWRLLAALVLCAAYLGLAFGYPMLRYKPQTRWLEISAYGVESQIAGLRMRAPWPKVREVRLERHAVAITLKSGNAMLIPRRAFADEAAMAEFYAASRRWREPGPTAPTSASNA